MLLIDVTIVNVALPRMATDLSTSVNALQWVVDGYAPASACCCSAPARSATGTGTERLESARHHTR
jgi:hypothetical protein